MTALGLGMKAVNKRANRALTMVRELEAVAQRQRHTQCFHAAWIVLSRVIIHAFDYDARLVGAARLKPVVRPVYDNIPDVAAHLAGGMDDQAKSQIQLPAPYGGCALRLLASGPYAHASRAATHISTKQALTDIMARMGSTPPAPFHREVLIATQALEARGIQLSET